MNALCAVIFSLQAFALAAWLWSLAAGGRLLGEYKAICAAAALAAALALAAAPLARAPYATPRETPLAGTAAATSGAALEPAALAGKGALGERGPGAATGSRAGWPSAAAEAVAFARGAAVGLCAIGALLFCLRLARYVQWARGALRRSVLVGREGGIELRTWDGPACSFGMFWPVALLPETGDRDRDAAMRLHEGAHLALGHVYWNFLQEMAADLFWFNPIFRTMERRGREAREFEADESAARGMGRAAYAESLVAEAEAATRGTGLRPAIASLWGAGLAERIGALSRGRKRPSALALASLAAAAALCAGAASPLAAQASPAERRSAVAAAAPSATAGPRFLPGPSRVIEAAGAVRVTQPYGEAVDPIDGSRYFHEGLDLAVPGDSRPYVVAWDAGRVSRSGFDETYGNFVELVHAGGFVTFYSKLSVRSVEVGDEVERGRRIGVLGSTGRSTGPHLHFVLSKDGAELDPSPYL
jgi:murein DD-endopeptidase MepM/ murein hydrolase activator NlpD